VLGLRPDKPVHAVPERQAQQPGAAAGGALSSRASLLPNRNPGICR
jgi:hypothetical protein